jgi:Flp pilus assembly protein TadD
VRSRRRRLGWRRLALTCVALIAGAVQIPGIVSSDRVAASNQALAFGFDHRAVALASQATRAEPWAASPYAMRSLAELRERRFKAARADALRAIRREPTDWQHRALLARIDFTAGDAAGARRALDAVARLGPALAPSVSALKHRVSSKSHERPKR